jgi:formylglycine-generating enzyme required for sulfatase activity
MTEFEYEKAARGPVAPVNGEFAWGTADVALLTYGNTTASQSTLSNDGLPNEGPVQNYNEAGGNAWTKPTMLTLPAGGPVLGPARVGMFARPTYNPPTPPRIQSGAGYYGVMDLTGNVAEVVARWTFPLGTSAAALFTAENGDGALGANGQANVAGWTAAAGATFFGLRGGSFAEAPTPVSVRSAITGATATITNPGIRGVRSAPPSTP